LATPGVISFVLRTKPNSAIFCGRGSASAHGGSEVGKEEEAGADVFISLSIPNIEGF
jgi:hypothetical protein